MTPVRHVRPTIAVSLHLLASCVEFYFSCLRHSFIMTNTLFVVRTFFLPFIGSCIVVIKLIDTRRGQHGSLNTIR